MFINKFKNNFKFKYSIFDFSNFKEVREIINTCKDIVKSDRLNYIKQNKIDEQLKDIYWLKIYRTKENVLLAEDIMFNVMTTMSNKNIDDIVEYIKQRCIEANNKDLYLTILNVCPNGSGIISYIIDDILLW